jgi:hypothetical protein
MLGKLKQLAEGRRSWQKVGAEMQERDIRFETSLCSFKSVSRTEMISEIGFGMRPSEKLKSSLEGFVIIDSIVVGSSERLERTYHKIGWWLSLGP